MEKLLEPGLVLSAEEVAIGFVDDKGGDPGDIMIDEVLQDHVEFHGVGFAPEVSGPGEAVVLVVVVVPGGEFLGAVEGGVGNAVPVFDGGGAEGGVVPGVGVFDADVVGDAKSEFVGFVADGLVDVAFDAGDLDAVGAHFVDAADAGAGLFWRGTAGPHIEKDAGGGDFAFLAFFAFEQGDRSGAADIADRGDAAGEPAHILVLEGHAEPPARVLQMGVNIDDARQAVHAGSVDDQFFVGIGVAGGAGGTDGGDLIFFDEDAGGALHGSTLAVDDHDVADDEAIILFAGFLGGSMVYESANDTK